MHRGDVLRSRGDLLTARVDHGGLERHVQPRRRDLRRRQQHLGGRRRHRVHRDRRATRRRRHHGRRRRPQGQGDRLHARPRRPRPGRAGAARAGRRPDPAAPRRPAAVGADPHRRALGRRPVRRHEHRRRRHHAHRAAHARSRPRRRLPVRRRPRLRLHRRHALPGRPGRDGPFLQRRRPDRRVDPGAAVRPARRHRRTHRATATTPRSAPRRRRSERVDQQRRALPVDAGQDDRGLFVAGERESPTELLGHDVDAPLLDRQPADLRSRSAARSGFSR